MATSRVEIDLTYLGLEEADVARMAPRAAEAVDTTARLRASGRIGFFDLADGRDVAKRALDYARRLPPEIENFVVLGIGGSSLGPRALYAALARPFDPLRPRAPGMPRRLFFPDNVDPVTFAGLLEMCSPEKTVWNVVTKSGGTAETAAQTLVVFERLEKALGRERARRHIVVTTDPEKGALRRLAQTLGLEAFDVPPSVGGRFSVLSAVGLLPAAAAGLDVMGLLDGARAMRRRCADERDVWKNPALLLAVALHLQDVERRRPIHVLMPYVDALLETAQWFQQLWAESLGKNGRGPTPLAARGATDQHSQLQLFMEGPDDKVVMFVTARERGAEIPIPARLPPPLGEIDEYAYLAGHGLGELLDAECRGTRLALARAGRPTLAITLERVDAPSLGELFLFFEAATAFAGPLYGVDPYDQPGVELGKKLTFGLLGRPGYESYRAEAEAEERRNPRFVV